MNYTQTVNQIIRLKKKGIVNNSADKGGPTNFGITEKVARLNGYLGDMKDLPLSIAEKIYKMRYIISPGFDRISFVSEKIAEEVIDTGVNMGPATAATILQRLFKCLQCKWKQVRRYLCGWEYRPCVYRCIE